MRSLASASLALVAASIVFLGAPAPGRAADSLDDVLRPYLAQYELPALAAAVVKDGAIVASGAVGTRKAGSELPVTVNDRFHIGSDTKSMTALLAAMLVEEKKLRWNSTIGEVFPELATTMDAGLRHVTLEQLLSHTSGIPSDNQKFGQLIGASFGQDGNLDDVRYWLVQQWSTQPLATKPGTTFAYSNMGYVIAGAMLERTTGKSWEELVTERVFVPLGLDTAGLGAQSTLGKVDAPLGHEMVDGKPKFFLAGPNGDNPLVIGPAGTAHMSVLDFARWAAWNAGEGKHEPTLVSAAAMTKLHTPVIEMAARKDAAPGTPSRGGYALGWGVTSFEWSQEPFVFHGGSNQKNLAHVLLQPKHDFGMVLMTNIGGKKADQAFAALAKQLYAKYGSASAATASPAP